MEVATIQKWGNSQGVRIPKRLLDSLEWHQGEKIILSAKNKKLVIEQAPANRRKNIKELFEGFNSENYIPSEIDWGKSVGDEVW